MREVDLTFGVEFEVILPLVRGERQDRAAYGRVVAAMQAAGVPASVGRVRGSWAATYDGSIGEFPQDGRVWMGLEMVSPILQGEAGLAQVLKVCEVLTALGCEVNKSCGLHVHIGAGSANAKQMRNLAKLFLKYEEVLSSLTPPSRRSSVQASRYCKANLPVAAGATRGPRDVQLAAAFANIDRAATPRQVAGVMNGGVQRVGERYSSHRYYRMNLQALILHGTVEFRQAAGTTNGDKSVAWIRLLLAFVAAAWSTPTVALDAEVNLDKLLRKVDRKTAAYLAARHAALNPTAAPAPVNN